MVCDNFKAMAWSPAPIGNIRGPQGIQGTDGERGSDWFEGAANPNTLSFPVTLLSGDMYLQDNGEVWQHDGTSWVDTGKNLTGPQGSQGVQGIQGTQGTQGNQGIQGTPGTAGATGERGSDWVSVNRAPNAGDNTGKLPGDQWLDTNTGDVYEFV